MWDLTLKMHFYHIRASNILLLWDLVGIALWANNLGMLVFLEGNGVLLYCYYRCCDCYHYF